MKKNILFVTLGFILATILFYFEILSFSNKSSSQSLEIHPKNQDIEIGDSPRNVEPVTSKLVTRQSLENQKVSKYSSIEEDTNEEKNVSLESEMTEQFEFKAIAVDEKGLEGRFNEQEIIDFEWKQDVEVEIMSTFAEALSNNSAWIENYECKYRLCRIEIKHTDEFDESVIQAIEELNTVTSTSFLGGQNFGKEKEHLVFFLVRSAPRETNSEQL